MRKIWILKNCTWIMIEFADQTLFCWGQNHAYTLYRERTWKTHIDVPRKWKRGTISQNKWSAVFNNLQPEVLVVIWDKRSKGMSRKMIVHTLKYDWCILVNDKMRTPTEKNRIYNKRRIKYWLTRKAKENTNLDNFLPFPDTRYKPKNFE